MPTPDLRTRRYRRLIGLAALGAGALVAVAATAPALGLLGSDPIRITPAAPGQVRVAVVYFSGDMGLKFGMGPKVVPALAAHGMPVVGVSSPALFGSRRTRAEVDAIVADAVRAGLRQTGAERVVLMSQSYGADIVATGAPDLPADLRRRLAGIVAVVPTQTVYFRADPLGFAYHGRPDARPAEAVRALTWASIVCIQGAAEKDSLCPTLAGTAARVVVLPGGHFLKRDDKLLIATILRELNAIV